MSTDDVRFYVWREGRKRIGELITTLDAVENKLAAKGGEAFMFIIKGKDEQVFRKKIPPKLPLKIRITGSSKDTFWYADKIKGVYDVINRFEEMEGLKLIDRYEVNVPDETVM